MAPCSALAAPARAGAIAHQRAARPSGSSRSRRCVQVRAEGGSGGDDLAKQFEAFKRQMKAQVDSNPNVSTAAPPRFSQQQRGGWNDGATADKVRRTEARVLNAWTSERGMQAAAAGTVLLVVALLVAAGGPPADARCTLPWC